MRDMDTRAICENGRVYVDGTKWKLSQHHGLKGRGLGDGCARDVFDNAKWDFVGWKHIFRHESLLRNWTGTCCKTAFSRGLKLWGKWSKSVREKKVMCK